MIIIKLGGSIITNKQKSLTVKLNRINKIVEKLKTVKEEIIIIHGGGSFGHYWSLKYNMHTKPMKYNSHGISIVKNSMVELNKIILNAFFKTGFNPYVFPASNFINVHGIPIIEKILEMKEISKSGLVPISYGDVLWRYKRRSYILSGDRIMTILSKIIKPRLAIFILNEDGIYSNFAKKKLIYKLNNEKPDIKMINDSTGGIERKCNEAKQIQTLNVKVFFVNGNKPNRIIDAINNVRFVGTLLE